MNIPKMLKQAEKLASYGNTEEAIEVYQEILEENPENAAVHGLIADLFLVTRQYGHAGRHLNRLAEILMIHGEIQEALKCYKRILGFLPKNIPARERLLEIYRHINSRNEILAALLDLCSCYERDGNIPKVIECLKQLCDQDPANESYPWKLATVQKQSGQKDQAFQTFLHLGERFFSKEKWADALRCYEELHSLEPKDRDVILKLAQIQEKLGQTQKAIELVIPLMKQGPVETSLLSYLARLCREAGRFEEAEQLYEDLLKRRPDIGNDLLPFIELLVARKKSQHAFVFIDKYFRNVTEANDRQKVISLLEKIVELEPQNLEAYQILEKLLTVSYQYERMTRVMAAHAEVRAQRKEFAKAIDLLRHCVDLEPYNKGFRTTLSRIEAQSKAQEGSSSSAGSGTLASQGIEDEEAYGNYGNPSVAREVSIVTDEDVDNFIVDLELLEKFGQHGSAIRRLEQVIKRYPMELKLRHKLKTLYVDRHMPKKAAQECLEVAKILQQQDRKEEANKYIREAQRLNPVLSSAKPSPTVAAGAQPAAATVPYAALKGDLSEIGLLDIIQLLDNAQKSGQLILASGGKPGTIFFNSGRMVNAEYLDKKAEAAICALVGIKGGTFEYKPAADPFPIVIRESNTNLLLEGLRLLDEANRDQFESPPEDEPVAAVPSPKDRPGASSLKADLAPSPSTSHAALPLDDSDLIS